MFQLFNKLFSPIDNSNTGVVIPSPSSGELSKDDIIDFLKDEADEEIIEFPEPKKAEKPKVEKKEEKETEEEEIEEESKEEEEEIDELTELEQEIEEPTDEQLELITPISRREILKKYPELFKDFPYLEKAYYRERQYTELLPTIEDAKAAVEKSEVLDKFEQDLIRNGNTETILKAVKTENPRAFYTIVDNYLATLSKVDSDAYMHVVGNTIKHTIIAMVKEADRSKNNILKSAAQVLNQFTFGSSDFIPPQQLVKEQPQDNAREREIQERELQFQRNAFNGTVNDLNTRVNNTLINTIEAHIDPKGSMTPYVKSKASADTLDMLNDLISKNTRFSALRDKLWEKCIESNYSRESIERIKSAFLSQAKTLLPSVIKKARNEALKGMGRKIKDVESDEIDSEKSPSKDKPPSQNSGGKVRSSKDIPKGMSTYDFLSQD